jgi:hypothetical protein
MFSVEQKRSIADKVQQILRDIGHPELPAIGEINFTLHVEGRVNWSWADIQNNAAVSIPSVNPWNEAQATPPEPQPSEPDKVKPLAQYLVEYLQYEDEYPFPELLQQALDAYESTENIKIRIERV